MIVRLAVVCAMALGSLAPLSAAVADASPGHVTAHAAKHHKKRHHHRKHHGIPQHNGGDRDADNNGGPSDGDGNI
jgi:hypothetical protein